MLGVGVVLPLLSSMELLCWFGKCYHRPFYGQTGFVEAKVFISSSLFLCSTLIIMIIELELKLECRAFVYEGFLGELECNHLISIAKPHLERSMVADNDTREGKLSEVRTSFGMLIPKNKVIIYV